MCVELEQTEKTDAAGFFLNERFFSLWGVLCAAEVFVVPWAFDKASCTSSAKSGASPQGPHVGVGSPAALCAHFIIWLHSHTETYSMRKDKCPHKQQFPYVHHLPPRPHPHPPGDPLCSNLVFYRLLHYKYQTQLGVFGGWVGFALIQSCTGTNTLYSQISTHLLPQGRTKPKYIATLISKHFFLRERERRVARPSFSDRFTSWMFDVGYCGGGEGGGGLDYCHSHHTVPLCVPANWWGFSSWFLWVKQFSSCTFIYNEEIASIPIIVQPLPFHWIQRNKHRHNVCHR